MDNVLKEIFKVVDLRRLYIFIIILAFFQGCGYRSHDVYFEAKNDLGWKDKYFNTSWTKEYIVDTNTKIIMNGLKISSYLEENSKLNFEKEDLEISVGYQSYQKHICRKEDIYIKVNNKIEYPIQGRESFGGDTTPPILGCSYLYKINPKNIKSFTVYFNNKYQIAPIKFIKQEKDLYHPVELM